MSALILLLAAAAIGYVGYRLAWRYAQATGTPRERLWEAVSGSATVAVSYAGIVIMGLPQALVSFADIAELPGIREQVMSLAPPEYAGLIGLALQVATYIARRRTL